MNAWRSLSSKQPTRPLTPYEASFWGYDRLGGGDANVVPILLRVQERLEPQRLEAALEICISHHPGLRSYLPDPLRAQLALASAIKCPVEVLDLSHLPADVASRQAGSALRARAARAFDLSAPPLLRATLAAISPKQTLLLLCAHHLVVDGWSAEVLVEDLAKAYRGEVLAPPLAGPEDFAAWTDARLTPERRALLKGHWRRVLADRPAPVVFQDIDYPPPPEGPSLTLWTSPDQGSWSRLRAQARACQLTPAMWVAGLFATLAHRQTGSDDLLFGMPLALRPEARFHRTVGCLTSSFPLRLAYRGDLRLAEFGRQVKTAMLGALHHADAPPELIQEAAQARAEAPTFEVMLNVLSYPKRAAHDTAWRLDAPPALNARFNATFYVDAQDDRVRIALSFDPSRISQAYAEALTAQFGALIGSALDAPDQPLNALSSGVAAELQLRARLSAPVETRDYSAVVSQIWAQGARRPKALAVESDGTYRSYAQLLEAASDVAQIIRGAKAKVGSLDTAQRGVVAIHAHRGFGLIASILGVWRAGECILLLDPNYPAARRQQMLDQANPWLTIDLSDPGGEGSLPIDATLRICRVTARPVERVERAPLGAFPDGEDAAYVVFTSGTTGEPKALTGEHRGLAHFVDWQQTQFNIGGKDRIAQITGPSFDVVLREIVTPLVAGAGIIVPTAEDLDPRRILDWMARARVSAAHLVPSLARHWLAMSPSEAALPELRLSFFAGEPLVADLVRLWRARLGAEAVVVNLYGPSETTLAKAYHVLPEAPISHQQPVGLPLPGAEIWVEAHGRQANVGEVGEVVIRTPYRTRGYLDPEANARGFRPNLARASDGGDWLYRTGDLGRQLADGNLQLLGRCDSQVKIRGVRVELDGLDRLIRQSGLVSDVATLPVRRDDFDGLVAYVVAEAAALERLAEHLDQTVPAAVRPQLCIVSSLPVTPNGKLDRARLPDPRSGRSVAPSATGPISARMRRMTEVMARHAGRPVGADENFFDAGLTSLGLIAAHADLVETLGVTIDVAAPLRFPTVRRLCEHLDAEPHVRTRPLSSAPRQANRRRAARSMTVSDL